MVAGTSVVFVGKEPHPMGLQMHKGMCEREPYLEIFFYIFLIFSGPPAPSEQRRPMFGFLQVKHLMHILDFSSFRGEEYLGESCTWRSQEYWGFQPKPLLHIWAFLQNPVV